MKFAVIIFRRTKLPLDEFSAGRNGDYIWHDLGTEPSVCNRPVTGSHGFGSSHRLGQWCLWFAALHFHRIENAEVPLSLHLLLVVLCHIRLRDAFKALFPPCFRLFLTFSYCLYDFLREQELGTGGSPITDKTACFHEQSKRAKWNIFAPDFQDTVNWVKVICVCALHVFFHQYVVDIREGRLEKIFRTVSTSVSEQELEIGGSHITDMTDSLHGQIRLEELDTVASDSQSVRKLWAVRPHTIFVMMLYTLESRRTFRIDLTLCDLHEFLCLNATDIHEGISEIVSGAISTSAVLLVVTVMSSSGVIVSLSDVPVGQPQPLTTGVTCSDTGIVAIPFVGPPSPDVEQLCMQLQDSLTCGLPEARQP